MRSPSGMLQPDVVPRVILPQKLHQLGFTNPLLLHRQWYPRSPMSTIHPHRLNPTASVPMALASHHSTHPNHLPLHTLPIHRPVDAKASPPSPVISASSPPADTNASVFTGPTATKSPTFFQPFNQQAAPLNCSSVYLTSAVPPAKPAPSSLPSVETGVE